MVLRRQITRAMTRVFKPTLVFGAVFFALTGASCDKATSPNSEIHAIVISLDGLRPDAISETNTPTLKRLAMEGAATLAAQTVLPTLTLPAHTSMMTGLTPDHHGITYNDDTTGHSERVGFPTMFDVATAHGFTGAMFVGKSKLMAIVHNGSPQKLDMPSVGQIWKSDSVASHVIKYLATLGTEKKPDVMFIHFPDIDVAGHAHSWMGEDYIAAVQHSDSLVANVFTALQDAFGANFVLIITADHGGAGYGHFDNSAVDRTTPFIVWGKGVTKQILPAARAVDVAPTMLWVIGIEPPTNWDGVPIKAAFPTLIRSTSP